MSSPIYVQTRQVSYYIGLGRKFLQFKLEVTPTTTVRSIPDFSQCNGINRGKQPFKSENMWLKLEGIVEQVRQ
jgi:hypothetical protein